jgi:signal transduction histidine kinase
MYRKKPETLALIVALAGTLAVLAVFVADLLFSRQRDLDTGNQRIQHFGNMMAEHTARSFEAIDVVLREMATDLSTTRRNWTTWEPADGWEYVAQRHSRSMLQLRDLIIFDRNGDQRFISSYFPPPQINVRDRPYFADLRNGAESATYGPYIGRNSGRYTYGLARRINDANGNFAGATFAALEPEYLQEFCWSSRLSDDFEALLINSRNQVVASCRPTDISPQATIVGKSTKDILFNKQRLEQIPEQGIGEEKGIIVSVTPVPGFPDLRVLTAIPQDTILATWRIHLLELLTLAVLVTIILLSGGLLIRRQVREMRRMTNELSSSHQSLEGRVLTATQELARQRDAADLANQAKSRFLAAASHDLRQPMHALALFAADLQRQVRASNTGDLTRVAEQIAASTTILGELLDSLLDISRLDVAGIKPDIRPFPLTPIFLRLLDSSRRPAAERKLKLRIVPTRLWVLSDPVMVERMIANLLSNALRYTPPGGRILVAARRRGDKVRIEVRDSGVGIPSEHRETIFTEFFQVSNTAREHDKGLGLGLSIVDRLARALEIDVNLRSRVGEGSTFTLTMPGSEPQIISEQPSPAAPPVLQAHFIGNSPEIQAAAQLAENWDYQISQEDDLDEQRAPRIPRRALLVLDAALAEEVMRRIPADRPLIILGTANTDRWPEKAFCLPLPLRPAKLRALFNQIQNTSAKSIP